MSAAMCAPLAGIIVGIVVALAIARILLREWEGFERGRDGAEPRVEHGGDPPREHLPQTRRS